MHEPPVAIRRELCEITVPALQAGKLISPTLFRMTIRAIPAGV
jgi:hypothetical protein